MDTHRPLRYFFYSLYKDFPAEQVFFVERLPQFMAILRKALRLLAARDRTASL